MIMIKIYLYADNDNLLQLLYDLVSSYTAEFWAQSFIKELVNSHSIERSSATPYLNTDLLIDKYKSSKKRLLLFDYDVSHSFWSWSIIVKVSYWSQSFTWFLLGHLDTHCQDTKRCFTAAPNVNSIGGSNVGSKEWRLGNFRTRSENIGRMVGTCTKAWAQVRVICNWSRVFMQFKPTFAFSIPPPYQRWTWQFPQASWNQ